jgi:branched-chain amino acid transport system ATP-binding protein
MHDAPHTSAQETAEHPSSVLLQIRDLNVHYGGIQALTNVNLEVRSGQLVTLIGANGAGKTTLLRAVSRIVEPSGGSIHYEQHDLRSVPSDQVVRRGVAHCPEGRRVLARQTVEQNLLLGAYTRSDRAGIQQDLRTQYERFPKLEQRRRQLAGTLSGGEQQMLAIARALMSRPRLLLLDEPSLGLAPKIVFDIFAILGALHRAGTTILLIEQNAGLALRHADYGYVLESGRVLLHGNAAELADDNRVRQAYLG